MASRSAPTLAARERRVVSAAVISTPSWTVDAPEPVWRPERAVAVRVHRPDMPPVVLALREDTRYVVGRHDAADMVFESGAVSRLHGVLRSEEGRWLYQDYDSKNGS